MRWLWVAFALLVSISAHAQDALVVTTCGTLPQAYNAGSTRLLTQDVNGKLCSSAGIFTGNVVLSGVGIGNPRQADSIIYFNGNVTGTCNNAGANCPLVDIVTNTGVVSVGASAAEGIRCLTYLRAAQNGNYVCGDFQTQVIETTAGSNINKNYIGLNAAFIASASDLGNGFAIGTFCNVLSGVTVTTCTGAEAGLALIGTGSTSYQYGWAVLMESVNTAAATIDSAAFSLGVGAGGVATLSCALCSGYNGGNSALAAGADFIAHHGAGTKPSITNFLNFNGWTASNYQILLADGTSGFSAFGSLLLNVGRQIAFVGGATLDGPAAATLRLGSVDVAAPVAQTILVSNVVAGTSNTAGANFTIDGSLSTGSGLSGDIIFQTGGTGAGATVQNALVTAMTIKGATQAVNFAGGITTNAGGLTVNNGNFTLGAANLMQWSGRAIITSPAAATFHFGNTDAAAPAAQTVGVQGVIAGTNNTAGANWTIAGSVSTGTGAGGSIIFQTSPVGGSGTVQNASATVMTLDAAKLATFAGQINVAAMTQTSVAQSGTVCYNSGTGAITYDATVGCLTSTVEAKDGWADISPADALRMVVQMKPGTFTYKLGLGLPEGPQVGFSAQQIAQIDDRLVGHRPNGDLAGVRYQQASSLYAGAIQALETRLQAIETRIR